MSDRPALACVICPPPADGRSWKLAADGHLCCWRCHDRTADNLHEIPHRFASLDPSPVNGDGGRRAPGFAPTAPINTTVVAILDARTTWTRPGDVHAVLPVLASWVRMVAEERGVTLPPSPATAAVMCRYLRTHLDWATRQPWVDELAAEVREIRDQLRAATGDPRPRPIGYCPNEIDGNGRAARCGAPLRVPPYGDTVRCGSCKREWPRREWLWLGGLLETA